MKRIARTVEAILWNSRFLSLIAVVASFIGALVLFYISCVDVLALIGELGHYVDHSLGEAAHQSLRVRLVSFVVEIADTLLFAIVLLIFAIGIYELFVGRIEAIERSQNAGRVLGIHTIDELKERLAKVIFLILIVNYFEFVLDLEPKSPLEVLYLAVGVVLIGLGIFLTKTKPAPVE